jgi:hypothetical protein
MAARGPGTVARTGRGSGIICATRRNGRSPGPRPCLEWPWMGGSGIRPSGLFVGAPVTRSDPSCQARSWSWGVEFPDGRGLGVRWRSKYWPVQVPAWDEAARKATRRAAFAGQPCRWTSRRSGQIHRHEGMVRHVCDRVMAVQVTPGWTMFTVICSGAALLARARVNSTVEQLGPGVGAGAGEARFGPDVAERITPVHADGRGHDADASRGRAGPAGAGAVRRSARTGRRSSSPGWPRTRRPSPTWSRRARRRSDQDVQAGVRRADLAGQVPVPADGGVAG